MGRRRLVVLLSAIAMIVLTAGVVAAFVAATQSVDGRDWIRRQLVQQLGRGVRGRLHLGTLSGSFLTDLTIDSVLVTGPDDSVFVATGRVRLTYDPRDLFDGRIIVRSLEIQHPLLVMRRENDDRWNFKKIFPGDDGAPSAPPARRAFGALVVLQNVRLRDGHFQLTLPWSPDDSLLGARRDSSAAANMAIARNEIRRVSPPLRGWQRTWRWTEWNATFTRVRLRHPDSTGRQFDVARMDVVERVPPLPFRNMRGVFDWRGDSVWLALSHFELAASTARATGKVHWGSDLPLRWDVNIHSDSVKLSDFSWIHETLPVTGGGKLDLRIHNQRDLHVIDYAITNMDARTRDSRLLGNMTYGVGGPVLQVKDVDLRFAPLDFALLETLHGGRFPLPWSGRFTGSLRARGGNVNHFAVDALSLEFTDRNVPGATAGGEGRGEIDILDPAATAFHRFALNVTHFDLRTAQFVNRDFPKLNGIVAGTTVLDSVWSDVRFRDGDFTHRDSTAEPTSRVKGSGRVTLGDERVDVDVALAALPLSATTLARSFPKVPLRGDFTGPLRVKGSVGDLAINADLTGDAGDIRIDGTVDALKPRYRVAARGTLANFDMQRALQRPGAPTSELNGRFVLQVEGDSVDNLFGTAHVALDRSLVDSVRVYSARAGFRFGGGIVRVDSFHVASAAGTLDAIGGLGLTARRRDVLTVRGSLDSLGGLRRFLPGVVASGTRSSSPSAADSLDGALKLEGSLSGSLARFAFDGTLTGSDLLFGAASARRAELSAHVDELPDSISGTVGVNVDALHAGRIGVEQVTARAELSGPSRGRGVISGRTLGGADVRSTFELAREGDTTAVRFDVFSVRTPFSIWTLDRPARLAASGGGIAVDSVVLSTGGEGAIRLSGRLPAERDLAMTLDVSKLPLADVGAFVETHNPLEGMLSTRLDLRGTRANPDITMTALLRDATIAGVRLEQLSAEGRYATKRLTSSLTYQRGGAPALRAQLTLPVDFSFGATGSRLLEEPLSGRVRADATGLAILETLSRSVSAAQGSLAFDIDLAGTWRHPLLRGALAVHDGALTLAQMGTARLSNLEVDVRFLGDSIEIRRASAHAGSVRTATAGITGVIGLRDADNPTFDLRLTTQNFNLVNRPRLADLDLSGEMRLSGAYDAAVLSGSLTVDRGTIFVPELYQKRVISLDDPELYRVADTSAFADPRFMPELPPRFVNNLTVRSVPVQMGRDVWLRSSEANINLGGLVNITRGRVQRGPRTGEVQLGLDGALQTVRGTYRLNLGPVQRAFEVENGELRFYGDPGLDATLNINALHTVRQFSQQNALPDVRVRVHIGGTRLSPTADLSSPDSLRVTRGDLISYLVTGGPSLEITGRNGDYTSTAARVLLSSSFSVLAAKATGRICDDAQLSAAGLLEGYQGRLRDVSGSILSGTRFNCAKQISDKLFVRFDYGFCQVGQLLGGTAASERPIADALGLKLDYRLTERLTASAGTDAPTSAVLCSSDANARGFAPTPRQFGLDLFRFWRF